MKRVRAALDAINQGIMVVECDGRVSLCNAEALRLLDLPAGFAQQEFTLAETGLDLCEVPAGAEADGFSFSISREADTVLDVTVRRVRDGSSVLIFKDIGAGHARETMLREAEAEAEHRSLFENSVHGIYRDTLDGKPVRGNPALAALNGYGSEAEYIAAVTATPGNWYVDPGRAGEFRRLIERDGRVKDMVSEVYRHRTREKIWITENAWYVRDADGQPLFIAGTIQDASERVQGLVVIERQANTDALTGAASRFRFLNHLNSETTPEKSGCVLFSIDLDRFKEVNDLLGHGAGDVVLKTVVARLQAIATADGLVARLGGDEFAIIHSGPHCHMEADSMARSIVKAMRQPIAIEGHNVSVGASVGVAVYPAHAASAEELLGHADLALYQVKTNGRNNYRLFGHDLKTSLQRRKSLETELLAAITNEELELYYQPIMTADAATVVGYEALMRWHHPRLGFLPPSQFISIAEEAGLMSELGNWAIRRACRQIALLPAPLSVAVNVSPNQFRSAGILSEVRKALAETGLDPSRLELEITESVILSSEAVAYAVISELQTLGIKFALDDFGTGYASLSYLQRYAFSKLKIDRSFVAGIERGSANLAIVRAIVGLCRDLAIDVVAEGIETTEQADLLRAENCQLLQGYLFGKPKPFPEVAADHAVSLLEQVPRTGLNPKSWKNRAVHKAV